MPPKRIWLPSTNRLLDAFGQHHAGTDRVDADALRRIGAGQRLGQRHQAALGHDVDMGDVIAAQRHHGGKIHHAAAALRHHLRDDVAAAQERALEVEVDGVVPDVEADLRDRLVVGHRAAGAIQQHVEAAEFVLCLLHHRLDALFIGDVGADEMAASPASRALHSPSASLISATTTLAPSATNALARPGRYRNLRP